jgi:DNA-binding HxlR family transcriptional regulator
MINGDDLYISLSQNKILKHLTNKWSPKVIIYLQKEAISFGRIRRSLLNISQRMLTHTLRNLESDGLVQRNILPTYPPTVQYQLTERGIAFKDKIICLNAWAKQIDNHSR